MISNGHRERKATKNAVFHIMTIDITLPYDLGALGYYYTGRYEKALEQIKKALKCPA